MRFSSIIKYASLLPSPLWLFYLYAPGRFSESLYMDYKENKRIMEK